MSAVVATGQLYKCDANRWLLRGDLTPVSLTDSGVIGEVHIADVGEWLGHPQGSFEFTAEVFDQMIANAEAQKTPLSFDYDHRAFNDVAPDSRAAGWIKKLYRTGEGDKAQLWATVEWTARAAESIRAGEFKFCSPAWVLNETDRKSGKEIGARLLNIALTNIPFLDGQTPITCTQRVRRASETSMEDQDPKTEPEDKKTADDTGTDDGSAALGAFVEAIASAAGVDAAAAIAALSDLTEQISDMVRKTLDQDGMPAEATVTASDAKPGEGVDASKLDRTELALMASQVQKLSQTVTLLLSDREAAKAAAEKAQQEAAAKAEADKAAAIEAQADAIIAEGRALDTDRTDLVFLLTNRPESVARIYGEKRVAVGQTQIGDEPKRGETTSVPVGLSERQAASYRRLLSMGAKPEKALKLAQEIEHRALTN